MKILKNYSGFTLIELLIGVMFLMILTKVFLGPLVDEKRAARTAGVIGFAEVQITNRKDFFVSWRGCSMGDHAMFEMSGVNIRNQRVKFDVCCGLFFKGCTLRTE